MPIMNAVFDICAERLNASSVIAAATGGANCVANCAA